MTDTTKFINLCLALLSLGQPRHLFLDPAILVRTDGAELKLNPAQRRETMIYRYHSTDGFRWQRDERALIEAGSDMPHIVWLGSRSFVWS